MCLKTDHESSVLSPKIIALRCVSDQSVAQCLYSLPDRFGAMQ